MCIRNSCNPEKIIKRPAFNNDDDENENMSSVTKIIKQVENFLYLFSFWLFYEAYDERLYIIHSFADVFVLCCKKKHIRNCMRNLIAVQCCKDSHQFYIWKVKHKRGSFEI